MKKLMLTLALLLSFSTTVLMAQSKMDLKLYEAVDTGNSHMIQRYVERGANINAVDKYKNTPLYYAIVHKELKVAKALIAQGANVNHLNMDNNSPLSAAVLNDDYEAVTMLMDENADPYFKSEKGQTA